MYVKIHEKRQRGTAKSSLHFTLHSVMSRAVRLCVVWQNLSKVNQSRGCPIPFTWGVIGRFLFPWIVICNFIYSWFVIRVGKIFSCPRERIFTGAQPKAGTGHKMQTVSFFQRYIFRDISLTWDISLARYLWECSLVHWNLIRHFKKHEEWRTVKRKIIAFWGTTRSLTFTIQ